MNQINNEIVYRFLIKCIKNGDCLEYNNNIGKNGYPSLYVKEIGASGNTHRVIYFLCNGFIPDKKCIMHSCDNRKCINPKHLFLGTDKINLKDMRDKGRGFLLPTGEKSFVSKISDKDIETIRIEISKGASYSEMAKIFNIHPSHISRIARGLSRAEANGVIIKNIRRKPIDEDTKQKIIFLRTNKNKWVKIANELNISRSAAMRTYQKHLQIKGSVSV